LRTARWIGPPKGSTRRLQFKLANEGTRPRSNSTVRYTEMAPDRFKDFWRG
jgi:hypothetical protein